MLLSCKGGDAYVTVFPLQFLLQHTVQPINRQPKEIFMKKFFPLPVLIAGLAATVTFIVLKKKRRSKKYACTQ